MKRHEAERRLVETINELKTVVRNLDAARQMLAEQLAEQNLRVEFLMRAVKIKIRTGNTLTSTGLPQEKVLTARDLYDSGAREQLLDMLMKETEDVEAAQSQAADEPAEPASGGAQNDATPRPETPIAAASATVQT